MTTRYSLPNSNQLIPIPGCSDFMEHRGDETLIWGDDWWEGVAPIGVFARHMMPLEAQCWVGGFRAGRVAGEATGRATGFHQCQAGLRALLGAASAADVTTLLQAAKEAGDEA